MFLFQYDSKGPYDKGVNIITHKERDITTLLHADDYHEYLDYVKDLPFKLTKLPVPLAHRPDLIAAKYYGSPMFYWLVMETNEVTDPYEALNAGDVCKIIDFEGFIR